MDGPSDVTEVRAPKRPYPKDEEDVDEEEEEEDVCFLNFVADSVKLLKLYSIL